jgi:PmbA protein
MLEIPDVSSRIGQRDGGADRVPRRQRSRRPALDWQRLAGVVMRGAGSDDIEAFLLHVQVTEARVGTTRDVAMHSRDTLGLGIRRVRGHRLGFTYTSDLRPEGVRDAVECAARQAAIAEEEPFEQLPAPQPREPSEPRERPQPPDPSGLLSAADALQAMLRAPARDTSAGRSALVGQRTVEMAVASSRGMATSYAKADTWCSATAIVQDRGVARTGTGFANAPTLDELDIAAAAAEAVERVEARIGARPYGSGPRSTAVVFSSTALAQFIRALQPILCADIVVDGRGIFAGRLGEAVASPAVSLRDDGTLPGAVGSVPIDDEGTPTRETLLVEHGTLVGMLHNTRTASAWGIPSTGNGRRNGYRSVPLVRAHNLYLVPGTVSTDELIMRMVDGLWIDEVSGTQTTVNPLSGHISIIASGALVRAGSKEIPVTDVVISGDLRRLLDSVEAVGSELQLRPHGGAYGGAPTLVSDVRIRGR